MPFVLDGRTGGECLVARLDVGRGGGRTGRGGSTVGAGVRGSGGGSR